MYTDFLLFGILTDNKVLKRKGVSTSIQVIFIKGSPLFNLSSVKTVWNIPACKRLHWERYKVLLVGTSPKAKMNPFQFILILVSLSGNYCAETTKAPKNESCYIFKLRANVTVEEVGNKECDELGNITNIVTSVTCIEHCFKTKQVTFSHKGHFLHFELS